MFCDTVKTERLLLRQPLIGDADRIVALLNNWNVVSMLARAEYPYGRADAEAFLARAARRTNAADDVVYAITIGTDFAGIVSISPLSRGPNLGYWLGEPYWGRGYMTEAVGAIIAEFFRQPGNQALVSGVFRGNDASLAVQHKFGFEVTGESSVMCVARGEMVEHVDTRLARQKYKELKS